MTFTFTGPFNPVMRIDRIDDAAVSWTCVGGVEQWADNTFLFGLSDDEYATYNFNWAYYLESLRLLCADGTGKPYRPDA